MLNVTMTLDIFENDPTNNGFGLSWPLYNPPADPLLYQLGNNFTTSFTDLPSALQFFGNGTFDLGPIPTTSETPLPSTWTMLGS